MWEAAFDLGRRLLEASAAAYQQVSPSEPYKQSDSCLLSFTEAEKSTSGGVWGCAGFYSSRG